MAEKVLILGDSGTGKSTSLRNFSADEIYVISCAGKRLPFKNDFEVVKPTFEKMTQDVLCYMEAAASAGKKVLVIDDAQYIMSFQYMRRIKENGWDKWNDIQGDFFTILQAADELPDDMIVYFLSHVQRDENGREKIKTMGKMLDEKITIEGLFTNVLKTGVVDGQYIFYTQNNGFDTTKSSMGLFTSFAIENDLKYVDTKLRNFYHIGSYVSDEQAAKMDDEAAKPDVQKPDADGRKRRKRKEHGKNEEEKHQEAPAEEEKAEAVATGAASGDEQPTEQPKRRRKRRAADSGDVFTDAAQVVADTADVYDGEIPFD